MQKAAFIAHSPYEIGDKVEVVLVNGVAVTGYADGTKAKVREITDILAVHSLKRNQVTFLYELDNYDTVPIVQYDSYRREKH